VFHHVGIEHAKAHAGIHDFLTMLRQVARRAADHYSELLGHGGGSRKAEIGGSIQRNGFGRDGKYSGGYSFAVVGEFA